MTRRGLEERLRVLESFRTRLSAMGDEMKEVLSVLPADDTPIVVEETKVDKGKKPTEGINAGVVSEKGTGEREGGSMEIPAELP